ncbi:Structural maintenance of chromosomes protein 3 [Auxenochlorella protothecoides]|uniref:Structural maintenance of chromosomes protein 3 n=1 Tax=Auxenochlorella protothecoides TaxID=3075 RepID=A0A087SQA2_AUXPR|nr:Structural maintenance of chromosomes protein 3 [Auxenochlorella protothecoides]KFM27906.1 Structural maintenance of chromosomes protein 3 [Auxenochlorella protothecoides]
MYIQQASLIPVIIEGFKSYKDQTSTELFSNNINVVAIRFVLNDLFTTLRQEDRERLLHEGAGNAVTSAYVELVFDNSDGRLPIDSREVRLRRSIGLKKDEYQLNKRVVTKAHVMSLLETAGFSRANPYYVVQQGKIMAMANMKDGERLELLKEIGGTRVYEERRRESEKLMAECETKRETIQGLAEKAEALQRRAALELDVRELERGIAGTKAEQAELNKGLDLVSSDIRIKRAELASLDARLAGAVEEEGAAAAALVGREARQQALFAKQGQRARYATAAERDEALTKEIRALEGALTTKHETQAAAERQAAACATEAEALEEEVEAARSGLADLERDLAATAGRVHALSQRRDAAVNRQKELWGAEAELDGSWRLKAEELARVSRVLEAATPRDLVRGLEAVERLVREHGIRGVHGTLLDLFDIDAHPGHATAVEVTAGNNLFYVVVDDDGVATQLTQLLTSQRAGRATFMPLNRLRATEAPRPDQYGDAVAPLLDFLSFDPALRPAMLQVFGKTLVCRDLAAAARVARETDVACVTMDGDVADRRGALRGGFTDARRSRVAAAREKRRLGAELGALDAELAGVRGRLAQAQQDIALAGEALGREQAQQSHIHDESPHLGQPLAARLGKAEAAELAALAPEVAALQKGLAAARSRRLALESEAEGLRQTIAGDLLRHQQARALFLCKGGDLDLEDRLAGRTLAVDEPTLEARRTALATVEAELARTYADEKAVADELELLVGRREKESAGGTALEAAREALSRALLALEDVQLNEQEAQAKRGALEAKLGDLDDRMRLLRPVSADAVEVHATTSLSALRAQLGKMNAELHSKYRPANRLALEQHQGFREQRDELVRRKEDNDEGERKIRQLISTLDMRKDEALERTFKGVAKNFRDIFATLVPGGRGEVVMQKRVPGFGNEENIDPEAGKPSTGLDRYVGVRVKVAFGAGGETMSLRQLSGGQKTLVALTLIFAIQVPRCDPAPFYLFDEIDAALDPQYRTVVADLLRAQSRDVHQRAQFIVTTFHPQLVAVADRVYAVSHSNRVSRVDLIRHEEAMGFLKAQGDTAGEAREVSLVA